MLDSSVTPVDASYCITFFQTKKDADSSFYGDKEVEKDIATIMESDDGLPKQNKAPLKKAKTTTSPRDFPVRPPRTNLSVYYEQLTKRVPFTREEEVTIFLQYNVVKKKIKKLQKDNKDCTLEERALIHLRNKIAEHNLKFVVKLARSFWGDGNIENFENLISSGNVGLLCAVDRFDLKRGTRFLSYAAHWIALEIRKELSNCSIVKVPTWWRKTIKKINASYAHLSCNGEGVSVAALSLHSDLPERLVEKLSDGQGNITVDSLPSTRNEINFCEIEHSDTSESLIEKACSLREASECINALLSEMDQEAAKDEAASQRFTPSDAVRSVYGLSDLGPQNLRQISNVTNVCSERIRQLKEEGLTVLRKKMRNHSRYGKLHSTNDIL